MKAINQLTNSMHFYKYIKYLLTANYSHLFEYQIIHDTDPNCLKINANKFFLL